MEKNEAFMVIEKHLCKEITQIAENIQKSQAMSIQDLEKLDKLYHTWKGKLTVEAMLDAGEYSENDTMNEKNQNSFRSNGYRNGGMSASYDYGFSDGYNRGYSEAMNNTQEGNSGRHPMMPNNYGPRRW